MSYDLLVFEPSVAPSEREAFLEWFDAQAQWSEGHSYDDSKVCSAALQRWFEDMRISFPPMNGPLAASGDLDDPRVTDHCCGRNVIYSAFASSVGSAAYKRMRELAVLHQVGFFAASESDGELLFP